MSNKKKYSQIHVKLWVIASPLTSFSWNWWLAASFHLQVVAKGKLWVLASALASQCLRNSLLELTPPWRFDLCTSSTNSSIRLKSFLSEDLMPLQWVFFIIQQPFQAFQCRFAVSSTLCFLTPSTHWWGCKCPSLAHSRTQVESLLCTDLHQQYFSNTSAIHRLSRTPVHLTVPIVWGSDAGLDWHTIMGI